MKTRFKKPYEELLVLQSQDGDKSALEELIRIWQPRIWRHALRLTDNNDAAWDVIQETWMVVVKSIRKLEDPTLFKTWVYRIVVNKCADWVRHTQRTRGVTTELKESSNGAADRKSDSESDALAVRRALDRLPYDQRLLILMHYQEDLQLTEIAEILDVPTGTVKSRLHYARGKLKDELENKVQRR